MDRATFFKHFDMLADTADSVTKMRELLLELALQGKLVPQDTHDEPATVLLEQITKLRAKTGKATDEISQPVSAEEAPYQLPASWVWTRLSHAGDTNPRNTLDDDTEVSFVPMKFISATYGVPVQSEKREWGGVRRGFTPFADNDVVVAKITPCFENGKSAVIRELASGYGAGTTELHVFRPLGKTMVPEYVLIYLKSPSFLRGGAEHMTGTAGQQRVAFEFFAENPFPLPPLAEQKRIVTKVEELMRLCDELEARQQARAEAKTRLTQSAFTHLTAAKDEKAFRHHAGFLLQHSAITFDDVVQLRQSILQLAVQGQLVRQDPKDEPAEMLFERIKAEKASRLKKRGYREAEPQPKITDAELLRPLPDRWKWVRLGDIQIFTNGFTFDSKDYEFEGVGLVRIGDIQNGEVSSSAMKCVSNAFLKTIDQKFQVRPGDLLIAMSGATTGKLGFNNTDETFFLNQRVGKLELILLEPRFAFNYLVTQIQENLRISSGSAIPNLSTVQINETLFPLPPLAEQKRIVAKVGELLRLCDELESRLAQSETLGAQLLDSTIRQLLAA